MTGDGRQPRCDVVLCSRPANYHLPDRDGQLRYICEQHRPFARMMLAPFSTVDRVIPLDDEDAAGWREMRAADEVDEDDCCTCDSLDYATAVHCPIHGRRASTPDEVDEAET